MGWIEPQYERQAINSGGKVLLGDDWAVGDYLDALTIINNYRSSHAFPLNTFQVYPRKASKRIDQKSQVAQRIKRLASIETKLRRFPTMRLSQMQDIGGCRAILNNSSQVSQLVAHYKHSNLKHKLAGEKDYISEPQDTGYRGYHLVYEYFSDKRPTYNGLKIEIQLRSRMQHAWATSVEVVGALIRQALKSNQGEADWLRFFALMSSAIASYERSPAIAGTPTELPALQQELRALELGLDAIRRLRTYSHAVGVSEPSDGRQYYYYLMSLDVSTQLLEITAFTAAQSGLAGQRYLEAEKRAKESGHIDAVLVSVDSLASLRKAYPNYFLDTDYFVRLVRRFLDAKLD